MAKKSFFLILLFYCTVTVASISSAIGLDTYEDDTYDFTESVFRTAKNIIICDTSSLRGFLSLIGDSIPNDCLPDEQNLNPSDQTIGSEATIISRTAPYVAKPDNTFFPLSNPKDLIICNSSSIPEFIAHEGGLLPRGCFYAAQVQNTDSSIYSSKSTIDTIPQIDPIETDTDDFADFGFMTNINDVLIGDNSSWRGFIALEGRFFPHSSLYEGQGQNNGSLIINPQYSYLSASDILFTIEPYLQIDSQDANRTHFNFRDFYALTTWDSWEFAIGARTIYWGVTESRQLVNIINQTDLVVDIHGTDKLGQPMISASGYTDIGNFEFYLMSFFQERTYPGYHGRVRPPLAIDTDQTTYESGAEKNNVDFATRYSQYFGDIELGLSYFQGTARQPIIRIVPQANYSMAFVPYYEQLKQTGLDGQLLLGEWLLKGEAVYRDSSSARYFSSTVGFEYTFIGIADSAVDCTVVSEWLYDERGYEATTPYQNDIMLGLRFTFNDINGTLIKFGVTKDIEKSAAAYKFEAERRLTDHWKMNFVGYVFAESELIDEIYFIRDDDYAALKLLYYF